MKKQRHWGQESVQESTLRHDPGTIQWTKNCKSLSNLLIFTGFRYVLNISAHDCTIMRMQLAWWVCQKGQGRKACFWKTASEQTSGKMSDSERSQNGDVWGCELGSFTRCLTQGLRILCGIPAPPRTALHWQRLHKLWQQPAFWPAHFNGCSRCFLRPFWLFSCADFWWFPHLTQLSSLQPLPYLVRFIIIIFNSAPIKDESFCDSENRDFP